LLMSTGLEAARALVLLLAANATPLIVAKFARDRWTAPLDGGHVLSDGQRLFGSHKTWRGLISGILAGAFAAGLMNLPIWLGAAFAAVSLIADVLSSMAKRRMKLRPGADVLWLDQLGEALLPLALFSGALSLDLAHIILVTLLFLTISVAASRLRHRPWVE
jgi:CDP-diglyceride synthetase